MSYISIKPSTFSVYKDNQAIVGGGFLSNSHIFQGLAVPPGLFYSGGGGEISFRNTRIHDDDTYADMDIQSAGASNAIEEHTVILDELYEKLIAGAADTSSQNKTIKTGRRTGLKKGTKTVKRMRR